MLPDRNALPAALVTGIDAIDDDHAGLFQLIDRLKQAIALKWADGVRQAEAGLLHYADRHFTREQGVMIEANYPEAENHALQHAGFRHRFLSLRDKFGDDPRFGEDMLDFIQTWLSMHIMEDDMAFAAFLRRQDKE